jgi:hypothetical protein
VSKSTITAALAVALATPLALSGCTNPASFETVIPEAVVASDPIIEDALVATSTGPAGTGVWVRIYVTSTEHESLVRAIDAALEATLAGSPARPVELDLDVAHAPMPTEPRMTQPSIPLEAVARELDFYDSGNFFNDIISGTTDFFEERYGTWEELHQ